MQKTAENKFDRLCAHLQTPAASPEYVETSDTRGALDLSKDRSGHRRFHAHYEDLLN
ncbi:hypothetical protein [Yoonia litorea]|uniref:Uncharacterized protein n=1 Tax=Yoonia litorea TaxID=1123755 RepID=A0A1I6N025_9RHOB|nr:hypothetical protein [Yoonia litorea]SFS21303.1 hypothetical protein SAMN05444714_2794 [Yoonia litorea]